MTASPSRDRGAEGVPPEPLPGTVDAHAHVRSRELQHDFAAVLQRAWDAGVTHIVDVGVDTATSLQSLELARNEPRIHAVAGLHPHEAQHLERERASLRATVEGGGVVGVGEIGLDFFRNISPPDAQYEALRWQLDLAREYDLPVVIHSRNADEECFDVIAEWQRRVGRYLGPDREIGMMHCFAGNLELAVRYADLGFLISVPGTVTYSNNAQGQEVARLMPLAGILIETDCPYLTPVPHRGRRNEPAYVVHTARFVASLRDCDPAEVARETAANAARLFGFTL
ncbi:MAG: hydrolase TatD [Chloroflexi bacterium HGW-Chloroflexi-9]|nr:MAG: hydrolase TatD [Chloroflexi bacterium HGW-Chloroflexi-9]